MLQDLGESFTSMAVPRMRKVSWLCLPPSVVLMKCEKTTSLS
jgi:hypothetical protein